MTKLPHHDVLWVDTRKFVVDMLLLGLGKDVLQYILMHRDAFILICKNVLGVACEGSVEISIFYLSAPAKTLETFA